MIRRSGLGGARAAAIAGAFVALASCTDKEVTPTTDSQGASASAAPAPTTAPTGSAPAGAEPRAAPPAESALSQEDRKRFEKSLSEGRALHEKKDYAGALKAFQAALAIAPDDPRALSELGWAAFFLKDLDLAEASTRKSLERAAEPYLKASGYYNLGRIQEERGRPDEAIASYRRSLEHRLNATVKARLAKLDAAAAAAYEILGIAPLKGPFVSLEAYCEQAVKRARPRPLRCDPSGVNLGDAYKGPSRVPGARPPYLAVRVIAASRPASEEASAVVPPTDGKPEAPPLGGGLTGYHLSIRTRLGWFIAEEAVATYNPGAFGITENIDVKELALSDAIPGGAPEVFFRSVHYRGDSNMSVNELEEYVDETLLVCGLGPSDKPSCTRPIPIAWSEHVALISPEMDDPGAKHALKDNKGHLSAVFLASGELEIKGDEKSLRDGQKGLLGKHMLRFP